MSFDVEAIRRDFLILTRRVGEHSLVYLDSANTSQKPRVVVDAIAKHYSQHNANVACAMYVLGVGAIKAYKGARGLAAFFIGAAVLEEVIFIRNASEALNLVVNTLAVRSIPGGEVVISVMERHSNIVPQQLVCEWTGAMLRWFDVTDEGRLDLEAAECDGLINEYTGVMLVAHTSNVLGTRNPVTEIAAKAHVVDAAMVVDVSQSVPRQSIDVTELGADLVVFTGHKMCGPTGIGALWGRGELLESLPPFLGGGEVIEVVEMTHSTYVDPPHRFEAGIPPIVQATGLGATIRYLQGTGMDAIAAHEHELTEYMLAKLTSIDGLLLLGLVETVERGLVYSFSLKGIHPHDVMQVLNSCGIAIRGGHHCARPLHRRLGHQSFTWASAHLYTTREEIDALTDVLVFTRDYFGAR